VGAAACTTTGSSYIEPPDGDVIKQMAGAFASRSKAIRAWTKLRCGGV
jgi:hypothetical protein